MRRIVIFGAAGRLGSVVSEEALSRGHVVVGVVREGNQAPPGSIEEVGDATTPSDVQTLAPGADALVCVVGGPDKTVYLSAARTLVEMVAGLRAPAPRILHSGGGGSLLDADGVRFVDAPGFSPTIRAEALGQAAALDFYRTSAGVTWTYMSPPPGNFKPGQRLGHYRTGADHPVVAQDGAYGISYEDYAVALVDEIEEPTHLNRRFTVGY